MGDKSNNDTFYEDGYMDRQYLDSFVGEDNDEYDSNQYYDEERSGEMEKWYMLNQWSFLELQNNN